MLIQGQLYQTKKNLIFRITTTGQSTPVGGGDNIEYRTRYTTNNDFYLVVKVGQLVTM